MKCMHILRIKKQIDFTTQFEFTTTNTIDFRNLAEINSAEIPTLKPYYQVFADKFGFMPNVSCLDALFNIGLETLSL